MTIVLQQIKKSLSALSAGYAYPATRYFVPDLNKPPINDRKLEITFPIDYQPFLQQHLNAAQLHLILDQRV